MKRVFTLAAVACFFAVATSCNQPETVENHDADAEELLNDMENDHDHDAVDHVDHAIDETGDAIEEAADETGDALDDAANEVDEEVNKH